ncbi:MAG: NfeD family protein [Acidimicrobiia bacterium]
MLIALFATSSPANAVSSNTENKTKVLNIHIGGYIDPHNESLIRTTLKSAQESGVTLYVLQLDSEGAAGGNIETIAKSLRESNIVTAIWVGPTSATYSKKLNPIVNSVDFAGAASKKLAEKADVDIVAPSLREFYSKLDGKKIGRLDFVLNMGCSKQEVKNKTADCSNIKLNKIENFKLVIDPSFQKLSPIANLGHSLIKPSFAIGLLVLGLCLLAFEFFAASVGVSAVAGALSCVSGIYGLGYLPTNWYMVALATFGVFALVIDVQAGGVGFYTLIGTICIFVGSFFATGRTDSYSVSIIGAIVVTIMALLFCVGAMPSLIRTRFGTPTIGREDFIGEEAIADGDIDPEGSVKLRGASWKARTNHATPIKDGEKCKVAKIEGIVLEVEPLVGAAKDYREKR